MLDTDLWQIPVASCATDWLVSLCCDAGDGGGSSSSLGELCPELISTYLNLAS
jgi:hypothetical protein